MNYDPKKYAKMCRDTIAAFQNSQRQIIDDTKKDSNKKTIPWTDHEQNALKELRKAKRWLSAMRADK